MSVVTDPYSAVREDIESAATDSSLTADERRAKLSDIGHELLVLLSVVSTYRADATKLNESAEATRAHARLAAYELADLREALEASGVDPAELDAQGLPTRIELDRLAEEGLLEEALSRIAPEGIGKFDPGKHARGSGGKFSDMMGAISKKGGGKVGGRPVPKATGHMQAADIDPRVHDYFRPDPDAIAVHISRLVPTRDDPPEHVAKARRYLDEAKRGIRDKRKPIDVRENGDSTLSIIDGNSTYAALRDQGVTHVMAKVGQGTAQEGVIEREAHEVRKHAEAAEPAVTAAVTKVIQEHGGKMEGLEYRLKSEESIRSKIRRKMEVHPGLDAHGATKKIHDPVRYTAVLPSGSYSEGVKQTIAALHDAGFEPTEIKNYWGGDDDYDGINALFAGPNGSPVEVQFHTPESLSTKTTKNHGLYETFRESHDPHQRWQLWQQMVSNTQAVPQPPGVGTIAPHFEKPIKPTRPQDVPGDTPSGFEPDMPGAAGGVT